MRTCLIQSKLPFPYWNYAPRHITDCQNVSPRTTTKKVPYEVMCGKTSPEIHHVRPFRCRIEFFTMIEKIGTISPRTENRINLFHKGGGVYRIKASTRTIRTKRVTFFEQEFPGRIFNSNSDSELTRSFVVEPTMNKLEYP